MSQPDMECLEAARHRWEMYLREVRPLLWQIWEFYALARPDPMLTEDGRLVMAMRHLPEGIQDRVDGLNATIAAIARQHGICVMPPSPAWVARTEGAEEGSGDDSNARPSP
jgi:hypothetical protein